MSGALSFGTGIPTSASTTEAIAARRAGELPFSYQQMKATVPALAERMEEANAVAIRNNPARGTYESIGGVGREIVLLDTWKERHKGLKKASPTVYAEQLAAYEKQIGVKDKPWQNKGGSGKSSAETAKNNKELVAQWEKDNAGIKRIAPRYYAERLKEYRDSLK